MWCPGFWDGLDQEMSFSIVSSSCLVYMITITLPTYFITQFYASRHISQSHMYVRHSILL